MLISRTGLLTTILLTITSFAVQAQDFVRSRPPECRCQFEMPGIPASSSQVIETDVGKIVSTVMFLKVVRHGKIIVV